MVSGLKSKPAKNYREILGLKTKAPVVNSAGRGKAKLVKSRSNPAVAILPCEDIRVQADVHTKEDLLQGMGDSSQ